VTSTVIARRKTLSFMAATLRQTGDFWVGPLSDSCLASSPRKLTCSVLKTVALKWSLIKLGQLELWRGNNFRSLIRSHWRIVSSGTISGTILKNLQLNVTMESDDNSVTVYMSSTMCGSRFRKSFKSQVDGSSPEFYLKSRVYPQPSCSMKNIRGKRRKKWK